MIVLRSECSATALLDSSIVAHFEAYNLEDDLQATAKTPDVEVVVRLVIGDNF